MKITNPLKMINNRLLLNYRFDFSFFYLLESLYSIKRIRDPKGSNVVDSKVPSTSGQGSSLLPLSELTKAYTDNSYKESLTALGFKEVKTSTQVTSSKDQDIGTEVESRDYVPGKGYSGYDHTKRVIGVKPDGKPILESEVRTSTGQQTPLHEATHTIVVDDATDLGVGILTSSKNPQFIPISNNNYKNQTVGASNQNPLKPKGQQIGFFDQPRCYEDNTLKKNYDASEFLTDKGPLLDELLSKAPVGSAFNIPQKRIHKDSSSLYHENGQPIFDDNGNEIEY